MRKHPLYLKVDSKGEIPPFLRKKKLSSLILDRTDMEDMSEVVEHQQLRMKIQKAFPECNEEKCTALYHDVLKCVGNKRYVSHKE